MARTCIYTTSSSSCSSEVLHTKYNIVKWERLAGLHMQVSYVHGYVSQMVNESNPMSTKKQIDPQMSMHWVPLKVYKVKWNLFYLIILFFFPLETECLLNQSHVFHIHTKKTTLISIHLEKEKSPLEKKPIEIKQKIRKKTTPTGLQVKGYIGKDFNGFSFKSHKEQCSTSIGKQQLWRREMPEKGSLWHLPL